MIHSGAPAMSFAEAAANNHSAAEYLRFRTVGRLSHDQAAHRCSSGDSALLKVHSTDAVDKRAVCVRSDASVARFVFRGSRRAPRGSGPVLAVVRRRSWPEPWAT